MNPIVVTIPDIHATLTEALLPALEHAFENAPHPVKGLVLTNPHNPLAQCYPRSVLEGCVMFCQRRNIHFISDEIYALTSCTGAYAPNPTPFVSALSLDVVRLGYDLSRVHTVWSTSKDFGQSGIRMVGKSVSSPAHSVSKSAFLHRAARLRRGIRHWPSVLPWPLILRRHPSQRCS